jgi:hypothetical protein
LGPGEALGFPLGCLVGLDDMHDTCHRSFHFSLDFFCLSVI